MHEPDDDERRDLPRRSCASRPASEPTAQNRNWSSVATSSSRIAVVIEPSSAVIAAPASASFTGVAPSRPDRPEDVDDRPAASAAPAKANQT